MYAVYNTMYPIAKHLLLCIVCLICVWRAECSWRVPSLLCPSLLLAFLQTTYNVLNSKAHTSKYTFVSMKENGSLKTNITCATICMWNSWPRTMWPTVSLPHGPWPTVSSHITVLVCDFRGLWGSYLVNSCEIVPAFSQCYQPRDSYRVSHGNPRCQLRPDRH